jgi:hypothetical protein
MNNYLGFFCGLLLFSFGLSSTFLFGLLTSGHQVTVVEEIVWIRNLELAVSVFLTGYGAFCAVYFARSKKD